ncbi:MAG: sigma-54-dependent Fis family transcriptional regulator [Myxococcales bacterium]|jgi:DNA-binding NtrC family response regulator|nr:sigma-54-dependent Fis family transcriptional regulator [Myxococcales bacterium]
MQDSTKVLVVDDDPGVLSTVSRMLRHHGMLVECVGRADVGLRRLETEPFDVVVSDMRMPGMSGMELLGCIRELQHSPPVIFMTAFADVIGTVDAIKAGAYSLLPKPVTPDQLVRAILGASQARPATPTPVPPIENDEPFGRILGHSTQMKDVYRLIAGVARSGSTVLVLGESGTGKELIARELHLRSQRADKPLVAVNCAAIPDDLIESELFGHVRGAFTGASNNRSGLFEAANGGTIFLDEIGDLPLQAQVKLLRVLQSGEIKPVGSDVARRVDVRVVAATNANLGRAVMNGKFRQDLYYRLNVIAVRVPPLRDRGDDRVLLAEHFLQKHAGEQPVKRLGPEVVRLIQAYPWPGNVRELEHAIERAVLLSPTDVLDPGALPPEIRGDEPPPILRKSSTALPALNMDHIVRAQHLNTLPYAAAKKKIVAEFTRAYVQLLMRDSGSSIAEAARRAGLDRSNFRRLMRSNGDDEN